MSVRQVMRAVRVAQYGAPEVLKMDPKLEIPTPEDSQVLVRVMAAGINPVDTYIRSGIYAVKPPLPYTPGHDSAGFIAQVGSAVQKFKEGDRVYTVRSVTGTYADYCVADENMVGRLHDGLTFEEGAGVGTPCYTAYKACIFKGQAQSGQTVLIHGASGAVGLACVQICKAKGLEVFGTAGTLAGSQLVESNGAHRVFNHREPGYLDAVMEATHGQGPHLVIEMLANVNLSNILQIVRENGTVVIIGSRGTIEINPRDLMRKESSVTGMSLMAASAEHLVQLHAGIQEALSEGYLKPHVSQTYPLEEAVRAHQDIENTSVSLGKRVFTM